VSELQNKTKENAKAGLPKLDFGRQPNSDISLSVIEILHKITNKIKQ
jgi:hypothetical protein